ncbi:GntR family transcriptional regulator [Sneathiella chinensis]|uniref:GntR family transcriptional regulator n=2 Tax=Sneathiella chinensis TaxID=349750 RepID=A0ABQ5TYG2_9PROT|nr:GntR family transcriptional regulator [Sneathiella chinensis]
MDDPNSDKSSSQERFLTLYTTIRERIALLDYLPGARLSETELASEFGISRTPLRRALNRLETEGLVESRHGVGTFVTSLNMEELREVYRLRKELAPLISILSPVSPSPEMIARIRSIQADCAKVKQASSPKQAFAKLNIAFFRVLMELVGNQPLYQIMELLFYRTARMWPALTNDEENVAEAEIFATEIGDTLRLLEAGDVDAVAHMRRAHISLAFGRLERYLNKDSAA